MGKVTGGSCPCSADWEALRILLSSSSSTSDKALYQTAADLVIVVVDLKYSEKKKDVLAFRVTAGHVGISPVHARQALLQVSGVDIPDVDGPICRTSCQVATIRTVWRMREDGRD